MKKTGIRLLIAFIVLLVLVALLFLGSTIRRSRNVRALADCKAELRAKGEKLTLQELTSPTNGGQRISQLFAIASRFPHGPQSPGNFAGLMKHVAPGIAQTAWAPTPGVSWADLDAQVDASHGIALELREVLNDEAVVSAREREYWPHPPMDDIMVKRMAAQWLAGAVIVELHRGRLNDAAEHLHSLIGIARVQREEPSMLTQVMRISVIRLSLSATWEALQADGWADQQLKRMQEDCESLDPLWGIERGIISARAFFLEDLESGRSTAGPAGAPDLKALIESATTGWISWIWQLEEDELFYFQQMQGMLESIRTLAAHKEARDLRAKRINLQTTLEQAGTGLTKYRFMLSLIALPNMVKVVDVGLKAETERELSVTAIALKRYQLRHHRPAPDLAALIPEFLPGLRYDPMSGGPLRYHLKPDGTAVLYSVGDDGTDDIGNSDPPKGSAAFGLWEGMDVVWPVTEKRR